MSTQQQNSEAPDHLEIARQVINNIGRQNLVSTDSHIWCWKSRGVWQPVSEREFKQLIQKGLENTGHKIYNSRVNAITDVVKTEIFSSNQEWNKNPRIINVLNGELHWIGKSFFLKEHDRNNFSTTQIPTPYDEKALCPRFKQFLKEIFDGDIDAHDKATALIELIGYSLVSHADMERFVLLVGAGANGKSVILEVIRELLGKQNVCAVQPSKFDNSFQRAHMHMKLANLVSEIAEGATVKDAEIKSITSGELTTAEHKRKNPFDFKPFCTCWFGTNHMPHTNDFTEAFFRRVMVIPFNQTFKAGQNADPDLKSKLMKELPGIMNLALQAYSKVVLRKNFTEPQSCIDAKTEWRIETDQVAQFVKDICEQGDYQSESNYLYRHYIEWANSFGVKSKINHQNFTKRLERLGCKKHKSTNGKRMIKGIRIKP